MNNIPCSECGFDPSIRILQSWKFKLLIEARSGNQIGSNGKGPSGWKYREFKKLLSPRLNKALIRAKVLPQANFKRRIKLTRYYGKHKREYDTDNLHWGFKPLVDLLKTARILVDDSNKWCERPKPKQARAPVDKGYIVLEIEEINVKV